MSNPTTADSRLQFECVYCGSSLPGCSCECTAEISAIVHARQTTRKNSTPNMARWPTATRFDWHWEKSLASHWTAVLLFALLLSPAAVADTSPISATGLAMGQFEERTT